MSDERLHLPGVALWSINFAIFIACFQDISILIYLFFKWKVDFPGPNWPIFPNSFFIFVLGEMSTRPTTGSTTGLSLLFWYCTGQCGQHFSRIQKLSPRHFTGNLKMLEWEDTIRIIVILVEKAKKIIVLPSRNWDIVCSFIAKLKWFFLDIWKAFERGTVFHGTFYFFFFHLNAVLKEKRNCKDFYLSFLSTPAQHFLLSLDNWWHTQREVLQTPPETWKSKFNLLSQVSCKTWATGTLMLILRAPTTESWIPKPEAVWGHWHPISL